MKSLIIASLGSGWIKLHPESVDIPENITFQQMKPSLSPETLNNQANIGLLGRQKTGMVLVMLLRK